MKKLIVLVGLLAGCDALPDGRLEVNDNLRSVCGTIPGVSDEFILTLINACEDDRLNGVSYRDEIALMTTSCAGNVDCNDCLFTVANQVYGN